ncbi:L,D-transpeptidase [Ramlibacter sp. WS9]|uniref:L,D-transpeptidase n=1 Tax=Ramlibacter sp. WS9 TaxID=1882741 RepID=UPI00114257D5|nr:L,D-transpeptidase [Ramlibacter sp. WS9]ROZ69716.1 L,D-transpeptidase [Ramlibacter sp. WS9]
MGLLGKAVATAGMWAALGLASAFAQQAAGKPDFGAQHASDDARYVAEWAMESVDHGGMPFVVVDKKEARVYVFDGGGRLSGASAALLGQAMGDLSAPAVGEHTQAGEVPFHERTTPAGRFVSQPGRNLTGEHVVWVDYAAAFAIHRVRAGVSLRAREARLASPTPEDNRASLGCVVVPAAFYDDVVEPMLGRRRAVVYVLPETRPVRELFGDV